MSTRRPHPGPTNDDDTVEDVNQVFSVYNLRRNHNIKHNAVDFFLLLVFHKDIGSPTSSADESETLASFTQRRLSELISRGK